MDILSGKADDTAIVAGGAKDAEIARARVRSLDCPTEDRERHATAANHSRRTAPYGVRSPQRDQINDRRQRNRR